ncbi:hypothetical protein [Croceitalea rosinachiae]|uniref:Outer membrane protein beta-barrel domain-containing protein n=1 Tax=Croceitalea rosinachiae TaxID=3075596 RepID=A0ABU3A7P3_9FLAO|nr:hypothetical protein [Croceitalea sp. F388]MDT0606192.1 hypothetical protein [Croceitalea sp. F388]
MNNLALLNLSFKKMGVLFLVLLSYALNAQEDEEMNEKPGYYYDVIGQGKIGFLVPSAYGNNFIADGYDTWNGVNIEAQVNAGERLLLGLQFQAFKGRVMDQELVGPINASSITHFFVSAGYSLLENKNDFQIEATIGFGSATLRNERDFRRFNDTGFAMMASLNFSYRLNYWLGFYIGLQNNWDFWSIERPSELDSVFGNTSIFSPSVGLKFYVL